LEGGPPCFPQGFTCLVVLEVRADPPPMIVLDGTFTLSGHAFQRVGVIMGGGHFLLVLTTPVLQVPSLHGFGLLPVRSPLLRESRLISSPRATEMFQFTRCPPSRGCLHPRRSPDITLEGLPHSESQGSQLACSSPRTFRRSPRPSSASSA
jgi:hypothetical protein